ncbi:hypothetical protein BKA64DRAFT_777332 [Cadophora sp. MPI-SDFR-AT-0126]|nr:hypothetical protein BKA64DRAFT_777332 [Leotiomycetes sp. MPI-SDFR-AT-0126]
MSPLFQTDIIMLFSLCTISDCSQYELDEEHFDLMNSLLEEAQEVYEMITCEARAKTAANPQSQKVLDAMGKWRQGIYISSLHDNEEPLLLFSQHQSIRTDPLSVRILSRYASQETLVGTNMANSVVGAESPEDGKDGIREDETLNSERPSNNSDSYMSIDTCIQKRQSHKGR